MSGADGDDAIRSAALARLASPDTGLAELISVVGQLDRRVGDAGAPVFSIGVSANASVDLLALMLKKQAHLHGLAPRVLMGGYATPVPDVERFLAEGIEHLLALYVFDNLSPCLEARAPTLSPDALDDLCRRFLDELRIVLDAARPMRRVFLPTLHRLAPPAMAQVARPLEETLARFNAGLLEVAAGFPNVTLLSPGAIVESLGWSAAFDLRFHFRAKAPYRPAFLDRLAGQALVSCRGGASYYRKVLAVDCDNTLWGGIVGEDGIDGIRLDPHDYPGNVYWAMQHSMLALARSGVLLCLCSKNNPADVDAVLAHHPHQVLRDGDIIAKAVGWRPKVDGLKDLAASLNLGLDSFIFLDDSQVECEEVAIRLPMVKTVRVPEDIHGYPQVLAELRDLFVAGSVTGESGDKTAQYRLVARAEADRRRFATHEEYLASLDIVVTLVPNDPTTVERVSELSQKSNQFNVTTRRYAPGEIAALMRMDDADVFAFRVADRHGDYGLTGVAILRYAGALATVESFFMSCRVLGRGVEFAVWPAVAARARARGCTDLAAVYRSTAKNAVAANFFERLGLVPEEPGGETERRYRNRLEILAGAKPDHLTVRVAGPEPVA